MDIKKPSQKASLKKIWQYWRQGPYKKLGQNEGLISNNVNEI